MKTYYIVKLEDGQYLGNRIQGPKTDTFVRSNQQWAVRFNTAQYACEAIAHYNLTNTTIEETTTI